MTNDELTENLLEKICYVIDILPNQIADFERYSEIEEYYLQEKELELFSEKIVNIVIKIQGYHEFEVFCENWKCNVVPAELAEMVKRTLKSNDGFLHLLSKDDNMLITINGKTLHISVYNPPLKAIANLSMLSNAEGLFMRRGE